MNLHALRDQTVPNVVLYQYDVTNPMNPQGLLVAYAEACVKPVVSDFDTFTVGSRGMQYDPLPKDQQQIATLALDRTLDILRKAQTLAQTGNGNNGNDSWNSWWP